MVTNVLEYLENAVCKEPEKIVFTDEKKEITYLEFMKKAQKIGSWLLNKNDTYLQPVAVLIDRNIESLIMFFGVIYSGNFYVPIDITLPRERVLSMLKAISPVAILGEDEQCVKIEEMGYRTTTYTDMLKTKIDNLGLSMIRNKMIDTDPLYAIFTSGSTGIPKAVLVSHRSVIDLVECFKETFEFSEHDIFGNQAPFDFDVSVKDIYSTVLNCATMHILPKKLFAFPVELIQYLNEKKVTIAIWATTVLCIVANLRVMKKQKPVYLKRVMFSGEVMPIKVLRYWQENLPEVLFVNLYGPTEITCNCTYYKVKREFTLGEVLPIGIPFKNTNIIVLNDNQQLVKKNEIGELCVRGTSLALGYYNNYEKTKEVFCQNPLNGMYFDRIYRTGDLVKYNDEGELIYCARKDFQIKHMGHRIELGEIEVVVDTIDFVERSCCLYDSNAKQIVLIYQSKQKMDMKILEILSGYLPKYMVPTKIVWMEDIPINKNSKIDRVKLKKEYII